LSKHNSVIFLEGNPSFAKDDDCFVVDKPKHLKVYLQEQLVVKEFLEFAKFEEKTFAPSKKKMQKERSELEG